MKFTKIMFSFLFLELAISGQDNSLPPETSNKSPNDYYNDCLIGSIQNELPKALEACNQAIEMNPLYVEAYIIRSGIHLKAGDSANAMQDANKAIRINAKSAQGHSARCAVKRLLRDFRGALSDCSQAIALDSGQDTYFTERGVIRAELKDNQGALSDFNKAIKLDKKSADAFLGRGFIKLRLKMPKRDACNDLSKAGELGAMKAYEFIQDYCN